MRSAGEWSWRVVETYVKVAGNWAYLYRALDSAGETIEFMLSPKRDLIAAKLLLRLALSGGGPRPRVINVDAYPAYASAIAELKQSGEPGSPLSLPNRTISKQRSRAGPSIHHAIHKRQVRWIAKGDAVAQRQFIHTIFGIAA